MRAAPGLHRERVGDDRPAVWYVVWLGEPHREGSVILGRSRRLGKHLTHRFFPERRGAPAPRVIKGWVAGAEWLKEVHDGAAAD